MASSSKTMKLYDVEEDDDLSFDSLIDLEKAFLDAEAEEEDDDDLDPDYIVIDSSSEDNSDDDEEESVKIKHLVKTDTRPIIAKVLWRSEYFRAIRGDYRLIFRVVVGDEANTDSFIRISCYNKQATEMSQVLKEGRVFLFRNLHYKKAHCLSSWTNHELDATFTNMSMVVDMTDQVKIDGFPEKLYTKDRTIADIDHLNRNSCCCVVAICEQVGHIPPFVPGRNRKVTFTFVDASLSRLRLTLWNEDAERLKNCHNQVVHIMGLKCRIVNGKKRCTKVRCSKIDLPKDDFAIALKLWWDEVGYMEKKIDTKDKQDLSEALQLYLQNRHVGLNQTETAKMFKISLSTFNKCCHEQGIRVKNYNPEAVKAACFDYKATEGQKDRPTLKNFAKTHHLNYKTFLSANYSLGFSKKNNAEATKAACLDYKATEGQENRPSFKIFAETRNVSYNAVTKQNKCLGLSKPRSNGEKTREIVEAFKKYKGKLTLKEFTENMGGSYDAVRAAWSRLGLGKKARQDVDIHTKIVQRYLKKRSNSYSIKDACRELGIEPTKKHYHAVYSIVYRMKD